MIRIRIVQTGEIKEMDRNTAHELIEKGEAELAVKQSEKAHNPGYSTRQLRPKFTK